MKAISQVLVVVGFIGIGIVGGIVFAPKPHPAPEPVEIVIKEPAAFDVTVRPDPPPSEEIDKPVEVEVYKPRLAALIADEPPPSTALPPALRPVKPPPPPRVQPPALPPTKTSAPLAQPPVRKPAPVIAQSTLTSRAMALKLKIEGTKRAISSLREQFASDQTALGLEHKSEWEMLERRWAKRPVPVATNSISAAQAQINARIDAMEKKSEQEALAKRMQQKSERNNDAAATKIRTLQSTLAKFETELRATQAAIKREEADRK